MTTISPPTSLRERWHALAHRPLPDRLQRRLYPLLFYTLVALGAIDLLGLVVTYLLNPGAGWTTTQTLYAMIVSLSLVSMVLAYRGMFRAAVVVTAVGLLSIQALGLIAVGLVAGAILLPSMMTAVVFAGLMLGWRGASLISLGAVAAVGLIAGFVTPLQAIPLENLGRAATISNAFVFACLIAFVLIIVIAFRRALESELNETLRREAEVRAARDTLQRQVEERTADLRTALEESTARAAELAETVAALERSEATVQQLHIPLIPVTKGVLLAPLIGALGRERATTAAERILQTMDDTNSHTLILDLTSVAVLDTHDVTVILNVARSARLMGGRVILVGIAPEVAQHIVTLELDIDLTTYATLEQAITYVMSRSNERRAMLRAA